MERETFSDYSFDPSAGDDETYYQLSLSSSGSCRRETSDSSHDWRLLFGPFSWGRSHSNLSHARFAGGTSDEALLYLDNDTFLDLDQAQTAWDQLSKIEVPLACRREYGYTIRKWIQDNQKFHDLNPLAHPFLTKKYVTTNNGILFYPNNSSGLHMAQMVRKYYWELVKAHGNRYLFDQVAVSIAWKFYNYPTFVEEKIPITHYYTWKYSYPDKMKALMEKIQKTLTPVPPVPLSLMMIPGACAPTKKVLPSEKVPTEKVSEKVSEKVPTEKVSS